MNKFSKFQCDFVIENKIKVTADKSIYSGLLIRNLGNDSIKSEEKIIVIKLLKKTFNYMKEVSFLLKLKYQGIARNLMMWEEEEHIILIQERIIGLSLKDYIVRNINLPNNNRIMIAYELAKIIKYLHSHNKTGIVHGDISPNNIMISENNEVYLIDFGSSFEDSIVKKEKKYYGTKGFYSPRIVEDPLSVDKGVDLYSFAMILKMLAIDKISIEGYELYRKCLKKSEEKNYDITHIMTNLLCILN